MVCVSYWPVAIALLFIVATVQSQAQTDTDQVNKTPSTDPYNHNNGQQLAEEVVVESSLKVRQKPATPSRRISREVPLPSLLISRIKRQFQYGPNANNHGSSQATAQSNSHAQEFGPSGAQNADAFAGAQAFQNNLFGATSNNAASLNSVFGPSGQMGAGSFSGGQTYNLPNGQTLSIAYNNGFSNGLNGPPSTHKGSAIALSG